MIYNIKLEKMVIGDYLNILGSKNPVPGGGSVSGITASQGVALVLMVLDLTLKKEKYKEYEEKNIELNEQAKELFERVKKAADADVEAFSKVADAYKMPKDDPNKKIKIGEYSLGATQVPFDLMEMCLEGCKITEQLVGKSNITAISDLAVAAFCFESAAKSAWLNVKINLNALLNKEEKERFEEEGKKILKKVIKLAKKISEEVEEKL